MNGFKHCDSQVYAEHNQLNHNHYSTICNNYECIESVEPQQQQQQQQQQHLAFDWLSIDNKEQQFSSFDNNFVQTNSCFNLLDCNQLISDQSIDNFALSDNCLDANSVLSVHNNNNNNNNNKHLNKISSKLSATKKSSRKESCSRHTKPVSAYALFFRDAQSVIKSSNPNASFGEISKVVASNWETLDKNSKNIYKQRADQEKKNYLKSLASSRAKQIAGLMDQSIKQFVAQTNPNHTNQTETNANNESQYSTDATNYGQQIEQRSGNLNLISGNPNPDLNPNSSVSQMQSVGSKNKCIRDGCSKDAIDSQEWDSEYCSSECCVKHCSDVFQAWVEKQQQLSQTNNT